MNIIHIYQQIDYYYEPNQLLFCGDKHGIIYEDNRNLYQIKLQEIYNNLNNFKFTKLNHTLMIGIVTVHQ